LPLARAVAYLVCRGTPCALSVTQPRALGKLCRPVIPSPLPNRGQTSFRATAPVYRPSLKTRLESATRIIGPGVRRVSTLHPSLHYRRECGFARQASLNPLGAKRRGSCIESSARTWTKRSEFEREYERLRRAMAETFKATARQSKEYVRRQRREKDAPSSRATGTAFPGGDLGS
jgi:hypothetical protein